MACAIGWALHCPPLVLFSLITVGYSANALGGAGGPLAVLIVAIVASELGKAVKREPGVPLDLAGENFFLWGLSMLIAAPIGAAASQVGTLIKWATEAGPAGHGHSGIRHCGRGADPAHFLCRHLRRAGLTGLPAVPWQAAAPR